MDVFKREYNNIDFITTDDLLKDIQKEGKQASVKSNELYNAEPNIDDTIEGITRHAGYIFRYDIDNDGENEIIMQQVAGSSRIPDIFIFKYDAVDKSFFTVYYKWGTDYLPFLYENNLYFCELYFNYAAGVYEQINLIKIDTQFNYQLLTSYQVDYAYTIPKEAEQYITNDEIKNIQYQDYNFLKNYILPKIYSNDFSFDLSLAFHEYTINVDIVCGSYACYENMNIQKENKILNEFHWIWGFTLRIIQDKKYIIILSMEKHQGYTVVSPIEFHLDVYELSAFKKVYEHYFSDPDYSLKILNQKKN